MSKKKFSAPKPGKRRRLSPAAMEWRGALRPGAARVVALGCDRLLVENHAGLAEFTSRLVRLDSADGPITIEGEELQLSDMRPQQLTVSGRIARVSLPGGGNPA
jgi:sporulation protein YqfC